jgi:hypothetical protein
MSCCACSPHLIIGFYYICFVLQFHQVMILPASMLEEVINLVSRIETFTSAIYCKVFLYNSCMEVVLVSIVFVTSSPLSGFDVMSDTAVHWCWTQVLTPVGSVTTVYVLSGLHLRGPSSRSNYLYINMMDSYVSHDIKPWCWRQCSLWNIGCKLIFA